MTVEMTRKERIMAAAIIMRDAVEEMMPALESTSEGAKDRAPLNEVRPARPIDEVAKAHPMDPRELRRRIDADERIKELE